MSRYGAAPEFLGLEPNLVLPEVMYYLYLPVFMPEQAELGLRLPGNVECCRHLVNEARSHALRASLDMKRHYVYLSARKGWATPDNPLNRPGWHCDGFGTGDLNYVWWDGASTRFLLGDLGDVPEDHVRSLEHFEQMGSSTLGSKRRIDHGQPHCLYALDPYVVHATPEIKKGEMRSYVKVSVSRHRYNLENNSHNYLFDYSWPLHGREDVRNDTFKAQRDYA